MLGFALGFDALMRLLRGAHDMDVHARSVGRGENLPLFSALLGIWNRNFLHLPTVAVIPYSQALIRFPAHLQQLDMESNGKSVTPQGDAVSHGTAPVVFGGEGSNVQHAYFQAMHQGTDIVPTEIVAVAKPGAGGADMHSKLLSNALAQAEALMVGRSEAPIKARLFAGDRPSTVILLDQLAPKSFGALIALYEHKTFVEGVIWNINSFDQWGVELGKEMANAILDELRGGTAQAHDPSTAALIERLKV